MCFLILEEKKNENLSFKNGHLGPFVVIFWHLHRYLSQKVDVDGLNEGPNMSES